MCKIKRSSREGVPKVKVADGDVGNLGRVVVEDEIHIPTLQRKREDRRVLLFFLFDFENKFNMQHVA